jgi:hypothetical protein
VPRMTDEVECGCVCVTVRTAPVSLAVQGHSFRRGRVEKPGYIQDLSQAYFIQGDQKVSVHLMITIQKVISNVQSVPRQSPDIY